MTANPPTRVEQLRAAARAMLDGVSDHDQLRQPHAELSPLLWHVGHVFLVETYWLAERVFGATDATDAWRDLYFPEICPKDERASRLPTADTLIAWTHEMARYNDRFWAKTGDIEHPLLADGYLHAFVRQHYGQHLETMRLVRAQLDLAKTPPVASDIVPSAPSAASVEIAAQRVTLGSEAVEAYDNEQPPITRDVDAFRIATAPVNNAEWLGFMQAEGYRRAEFWDDEGWQWREDNAIVSPQHWQARGRGRWFVASATDDPIGAEAVHGIGWYEARAFARYADARLPMEHEWEAARKADRLGGLHQVWEWCDNAFAPYPGFTAFPYDGYSSPWFDGRHFVARGGSWHTDIEILRPSFRNFYPPTHRHVFAGLRLAW